MHRFHHFRTFKGGGRGVLLNIEYKKANHICVGFQHGKTSWKHLYLFTSILILLEGRNFNWHLENLTFDWVHTQHNSEGLTNESTKEIYRNNLLRLLIWQCVLLYDRIVYIVKKCINILKTKGFIRGGGATISLVRPCSCSLVY